MKIFFVTSKLNNPNTAGGSVIELEYMMRELMRLGNDVSAVTVFSNNNNLTERPPYTLYEEYIRSSRLLPILWNIYKLLKKYEDKADIFHIDGQYMIGGGLYRLLGGKRPVLAYLIRPPLIRENYVSYLFDTRTWAEKYSPRELVNTLKWAIRYGIERFILVRFANCVDYVSCLNPLLNREHYEFGLKPAARGLIIGDPYPLEETMKKVGITETSYSDRTHTNDKITIYYSGRMAPGKGYDLLLAGFAKVKNKERYRVILGGSGPEENKVRAMTHDLQLSKYVEFTGWVSREQLYEYMKNADMYVFSRWGTTLSALSLMEAMAFGLPLIVPAGTGLAWTAGHSAITFEPENADDLARQIERLGNDVALRKTLSRHCYERLREPDLDPRQTIVALNVIMKSMVFNPRDNYPLEQFVSGDK